MFGCVVLDNVMKIKFDEYLNCSSDTTDNFNSMPVLLYPFIGKQICYSLRHPFLGILFSGEILQIG